MNFNLVVFLPFFLLWALPFPGFLFASESSGKIQFLTENFPPFNYQENGGVKGISVDILVEILKKTNSPIPREDIHVLPWARGYNILRTKEHTCLFSTMRSAERENLFKWVGPISPINNGLIALKNRQLKIEDIEDIKELKIGVGIDDVGEQLLVDKGIGIRTLDRIGGVGLVRQNILKMRAGRIDVFSYNLKVLQWEAKKMGLNPADFEMVYTLQAGELYYAFNIKTPDEIIMHFQNALDELKKDGTIDNIIRLYTN